MTMVTVAGGNDVGSGDGDSNGCKHTLARCNCDAQIFGTTWSERLTINVIA
jgi:hypothetical protein